MRYLLTLFSFFLIATISNAQQQQEHVVSITTSGEVELPADIIQFNINLNAEQDTPQKAYDLHKKREKVLVKLLDKYDVAEENIRFQPISINKGYTDEFRAGQGRERIPVYRTNQQVSLTLKNFDVYEKIQVTLIENGFDQFNGNFLSSDQTKGEDDALRQAIKEAKNKADIIAKEADLKLGGIKSINYQESQMYPRQQMETMAMRSADSQSLMKYDQTVILKASVTMEFIIN
ncbi:SIMPL domain-containing protein [Aliifodinibius sp. S!AR15-10]|uniref:SIMPL domain-containing protein n=1 Tax=Aliifodinibius sp. S!AR15-10 TaxID=2950437 RepID=UPI00285E2771|nr:SIMPL domain-containing protein [Aliifodinibius sp. S!AR15-10]MDR8390532.1 SIMPL domain-containing protein [Aliifodinibius sp. S!AR15-10]